jgi:ABC-2 type transport system permease protein
MIGSLVAIGQHKNVLYNFIARDLKVKYRGTFFGYLWSLLEPLSLVVIYYFVLEIVVSRDIPHYPLVVILGVLPYNYVSGVINAGAGALTSNASLVRRVALPREIYVYASVASQAIVFVLSMLIVIPFLAVFQVTPGATLPLFVVSSILMTLFATGIALVAACANVILKDVGYVLRVLLRIFFYGSPVIYPVSMLHGKPEILAWYLWNPMAVYLSLVRSAILDQPIDLPAPQLVSSVIAALASFASGLWIFGRWEKTAVKFL